MNMFLTALGVLLFVIIAVTIPYALATLAASLIVEVISVFSDKAQHVNIFTLGAVFYFLWVLLPTLYKNGK